MQKNNFKLLPLSIIFICALLIEFGQTFNWDPVRQVIKSAVDDGAFPGAVALVANQQGILFAEAFGHQTYDTKHSAPMQVDGSIFDLASMTKVLVTTTAIAQFYERGELRLEDRITKYFPEFATQGKETITIENLLLHNSGFRPDPVPGFWSKSFGCPESSKETPGLSWSCLPQIYDGIMNQDLIHPVGEKYVYSDLSMMTLHLLIGRLAKKLGKVDRFRNGCPKDIKGGEVCYYESYVRRYILNRLQLGSVGFLPDQMIGRRIPPAWKDMDYRHELIHGYVSDPNAYANGGIAGHAGLFSNVVDVHQILGALMFQTNPRFGVNATTLAKFTTVKNKTQSSRALGWDTNLQGTGGSCGDLSSRTYMHTGFTGTNCCNDPDRKLISILLTNRVYPDINNRKILHVRTLYNNAVRAAYDQGVKEGQEEEGKGRETGKRLLGFLGRMGFYR